MQQQRIPTEMDWAWIAGLFEGEGCFNFHSKRSVAVRLGMTDRDVIYRLNALVPSVSGPRVVELANPKHKTQYVWYVSARDDVIAFIHGIRPWLGERRGARADEALARLATNRGIHTAKAHCRNGHLWAEAGIYVSPQGKRHCRECMRTAWQKSAVKHEDKRRTASREARRAKRRAEKFNLLAIRNEVLANGFDPVRMSGRIDQYVNDAQYEIARRVDYYVDEAQEILSTTPGSDLIPFPSNLARVRTLRDTDQNRMIENVGLSEIDQSNPSVTGRPLYWAMDGANLHLYPTPNAAYGLALRYWSLPSKLVLDSDVPGLPEDYHNMLITYAIGRSYLAEDDEQTGQFYQQMFEKQLAQFHTDLVFPTTEEPHQARGMWDPPRALPGGQSWTMW